MTNVLPQNDRHYMWIYYRTRFMVAGAIGIAVVALLAFVSIAPAYIMVVLTKPLGNTGTDQMQSADALDDTAAVDEAKLLISQLQPILSTTTSPMELIAAAVAQKPTGLTIDRIAYSTGDKTTIILAGSAKGRGQVDEYRKALDAAGVYRSVVVPVGDLVGANGDQFTITLALK